MNQSIDKLIALSEQQGLCTSVFGDTYRILIDGRQTGNVFAVIDMLIPPQGGPGPHAHADVQESFYVVDGEIEVKNEEGTYTARKGAFVSIPKGGMVHCFKNVSSTNAHIICTVTPAGMEDMFLEIGRPVKAGTFLEPKEMGPDDIKKIQQIAEKYGQKLYPPDYLDKKA